MPKLKIHSLSGFGGSNPFPRTFIVINMKIATLCFLINKKSKQVLFGMKKQGFGAGKYNGFGGKVKDNEDIKEAAIRELFEECNVTAKNIEHAAELTFFFSKKPEWNQTVHVFLAEKWAGQPKESDEMLPKWFRFNEIPFEKMWQDDLHWLPLVLNNKRVKAEFTFGGDNESIIDMKVNEM